MQTWKARKVNNIFYTFEDLWDNLMLLNLAEDGTLYIGTSLPDEFVVWAINSNNPLI